ncbi:MAG TPA: helix-turn-helix transcriptional regulator [Opitutaceae bacterium]|nr:helix-turn-helix transcriptional regulator [Opitutaceae bacterium]
MVANRTFCLMDGGVGSAARSVGRLPSPVLDELSPAERRVLVYVCAGYSNKEIAGELGRAESTVKHQVAACLRKFGVPTRARLIAALR